MHESRYNLNIVLIGVGGGGGGGGHKVSLFEKGRGRINTSAVRVLLVSGLGCHLIHTSTTAWIQVLN